MDAHNSLIYKQRIADCTDLDPIGSICVIFLGREILWIAELGIQNLYALDTIKTKAVNLFSWHYKRHHIPATFEQSDKVRINL